MTDEQTDYTGAAVDTGPDHSGPFAIEMMGDDRWDALFWTPDDLVGLSPFPPFGFDGLPMDIDDGVGGAHGLVTMAAGAGVLGWLAGQRRGASAQGEAAGGTEGDGRDREVLRDAIDDLIDMLPSAALQARLEEALAEVGVQRPLPRIGEVFDPQEHEAVGAHDTTDPELARRIFEVHSPGLVDRENSVRLPKVRVHVLTDEAHEQGAND